MDDGFSGEVREEHENDTACEIFLVNKVQRFGCMLAEVIADGVVTAEEAHRVAGGFRDVREGAVTSLENNRRINGMYCEEAKRRRARQRARREEGEEREDLVA
jgi:hypothetical protein